MLQRVLRPSCAHTVGSVTIFLTIRHCVSHIASLSLQVVQELSSNVVVIEKLENFQYKDKNGKDFGENVRHRAKQLAELIIDPDRIREERRKVRHGATGSYTAAFTNPCLPIYDGSAGILLLDAARLRSKLDH